MISSDIFIRLVNATHFVIYFADKRNLPLSDALLLRIIFYSEALSFKRHNEPLTSAKVIKAVNGPVPADHEKAIAYLLDHKMIEKYHENSEKDYKILTNPNIYELPKNNWTY
jgi:hypothetical protein